MQGEMQKETSDAHLHYSDPSNKAFPESGTFMYIILRMQ